ncbi:hypothetical protein [Halolamina salifodinae]|uniref:Uncharacterized protein n=1 Tax=Halolamina salifodinae TaxID=1202767 RepID=A0A8T4GV68_9EURY|nr:hypothetical protein [Halolamina salifodinae]MBP1986789.1 hypothetical protein [Halolamina salifodinae]
MSLDRSSASSRSLEELIRDQIRGTLTTDLDADLVEYGCDRCQERCINPRRSVLEEAGVCLECHVHYAAHGHVRGRISSRWD